jgi:hypothetical protein
MTPTGSEHPRKPSEKQQVSNPAGTESGTVGTPPPSQGGGVDAELAQIAALWSHLPGTARTAMLALARAAAKGG